MALSFVIVDITLHYITLHVHEYMVAYSCLLCTPGDLNI